MASYRYFQRAHVYASFEADTPEEAEEMAREFFQEMYEGEGDYVPFGVDDEGVSEVRVYVEPVAETGDLSPQLADIDEDDDEEVDVDALYAEIGGEGG